MITRHRAGGFRRNMLLSSAAAMLCSASSAFGQATQPTLFVCNNGNVEGSTTSFRINADGTLTFVNKVITGTRININEDYEVRDWSQKLGVSPDVLKAAVRAVGTHAATVEQHLKGQRQ